VSTTQQKSTAGNSRRPSTAHPTHAARALRPHVIGAVFRRDFLGYFNNLAGYVFLVLFGLACALAEFCLPVFFANNLANLGPLDEWMPYLLLFFIPAVTMSIWADERRQGTDELLLTLPARDVEVVVGKYLAALGIYTVALLFLVVHVAILMILGSPDLGVIAASFLGYWLMGAMLIAVGMVASLLSSNSTVAFILGGLFAAIPVLADQFGAILSWPLSWLPGPRSAAVAGSAQRLVEDLSIPARFRDFGAGVITLPGVVYFLSWAVGMLYLNMVLLGRRHWKGGEASSGRWAHALTRLAAAVLALAALNVLVGQASSRWDHWATVLLAIGLGLGVVGFVLRMTVFALPVDGPNPALALLRDVGLGLLFGLLLNVAFGRGAIRVDASQEGISKLSRESVDLIAQIRSERPVFIQAYLSPSVPREYVQVRTDLLTKLREFEARGGGNVRLNLVEPERYSPAAREAEKRFGIEPRRVMTTDDARQSSTEIYLGAAFTSGPEEVVILFFEPGIPVEYELTRSIRVVSRAKRKKVGILNTDAKLLGGFDMRSMGQNNEWSIVTELKKQYDVSSVSADSDIPTELDALMVAQPSSLTQKQIDTLTAYVRRGGPTLLLMDPLPFVDPTISPEEPRMPPGGMFGGGAPPEPKGDLKPLLDMLGLEWPSDQIAWNTYNPTKLRDLPPEVVIIGRGADHDDAFNAKQPATSGLQEVVLMFAGSLRGTGASGAPRFIPLLKTDASGGTISWANTVQRGMMGGVSGLNPRRTHVPSGESYTVAARVEGPFNSKAAQTKGKDADKDKPGEAKVIAIADLDLLSETFFNLRKQRTEGLDFDNVTFVLNCVDVLAGDDDFIELRTRRSKYRTLERLERQNKRAEQQRLKEEKAAEEAAKEQLEKAQKSLDAKVKALEARKDVDDRTKDFMVANLQDVESRRLNNVIKAEIEDEKRRKNLESEADAKEKVRQMQNQVRLLAILLPPLLPIVLGAFVFGRRAGRENRGTDPSRLV